MAPNASCFALLSEGVAELIRAQLSADDQRNVAAADPDVWLPMCIDVVACDRYVSLAMMIARGFSISKSMKHASKCLFKRETGIYTRYCFPDQSSLRKWNDVGEAIVDFLYVPSRTGCIICKYGAKMTHDTMHIFEDLTKIWSNATVFLWTQDGREFQFSDQSDEYELLFHDHVGRDHFFGTSFKRDDILDSSLDVTIALYT